jgi:hypothetical protein
MKKATIAILGATSHIAKGLIYHFFKAGTGGLHLYARTPDKVRGFLQAIGAPAAADCAVHALAGDFGRCDCAVIINCIGAGTWKKLQGDYTRYFTVTEEYDNLVLAHLRQKNPDALYISLSSGAVYGGGYAEPVGENTETRLRVNQVGKQDYYTIARLYAEAKHRAFDRLNIADVRVFSYFSRFYDPEDGYFVTDVVESVLRKKTLATDAADFVRDYIHPEDLFSLTTKCIKAGKINAAFDATSSKPVAKREILGYFSREYGLKYVTGPAGGYDGATGAKTVYYSTYQNAVRIGYRPRFSSLEAIVHEAQQVLSMPGSSAAGGESAV